MSRVLSLLYREYEFRFELLPGGLLHGRLLLSQEQREKLRNLVEAEEEDCYLDQKGERLPAEVLFEKSPWSLSSPDGQRLKILGRFLNIETGEAMFSEPSTYGGESHDWLRSAR
jgi:hypothetical protein